MIRPALRSALMSLCALILSAIAALAADQTATLTWSPNTEEDLTGYKIYQSTVSGQYAAPVATVGTVTTHQLTLPQLAVDQRYYYTITAYDAAGNESGKSTEVSKVIIGTPPVPKPGTPALTVTVVDQTTLRVSWPPVDNGMGAPALIDVRLNVAPIQWGSAPSQACPASPCVITGLLPGTTYQVQAVASRPGAPNVFGLLSAVAAGTTLPPIDPPPARPQGLMISKADPNEILIVARAADCPRVLTSTQGSTATQLRRTVRCVQ